MAIEIGAQIIGIAQRTVSYMVQGPPTGTPPVSPPPTTEIMYFRDVTFQIVGLPTGAPAVPFTIAVNDATQWDQLQVGKTCTIAIYPPA